MKYAIVTGGSKGIGKAIVKELLQRKFFVFITYAKDLYAVNRLKIDFEQYHGSFELLKVDHSDLNQVRNFCNHIKSTVPHIDCIICNVGKTIRKSFLEIEDDDWTSILNVSLLSHFVIVRNLYTMISRNSRLIFIGSLMGHYPHSTSLVYGVVKSAVHALAKNLVKEFEGTGTTVNAVLPGFVETEWQKNKPEEIRANIYAKTATKRFASSEEIADACMFCLENSFVNGSLIEISGGYNFK